MQIDTAGTYTLKYTAEDTCGNVTEVEREVNAVVISYRTVLYTDGTFIINEKSTNQAANEALHGVATNVYAPLIGNNYRFSQASRRPWHNQRTQVAKVEIGSRIKPTWTSYWFSEFTNARSFDLTNLDTSQTSEMQGMFGSCDVDVLDLSDFDTSSVTRMDFMFSYMQANQLIIPFDTRNVVSMVGMFRNLRMQVIDISSFAFDSIGNINQLFEASGVDGQITTIVVAQGTDLSFLSAHSVFSSQRRLVGGAGTPYNSDHTDSTYAHIDGGTSNPGYFTLKSA